MAKQSLIKSFALVTAFSVATRFLSFIYKIIISRYFGAEAVGVFQMSVSFLGFFLALNSGLPLILSRKIAEGTCSKIEEFKKVTFCLLYSFLLCVVISVILLLSKPLLSVYFQNKKAINVFYLLIPAMFSSTIYSIIRAWLLGKKQFLSFSSTELIEEILTIFLTFIFTMMLSYLSGEIIIALAVSIADILCIILLIIIYLCKGGRFVKPNNNFDLIKSSVPITINRIVASLTGAFSAFIVPYKLIEHGASNILATATFGRFTAMCMPLISAPSALIGSLAIVLIPELSSLKNNITDLHKKIENSLSFSVLVAGLFVGIYMPLGKEITTLVFNDEISGFYTSISAVIIFPLVISQLTTSILNTLNNENTTLKNFIIGTIPMLLIITFLTKYLGILSLALGFFVSFIIIALLNLKKLNSMGKLSVKLYKNMFLCVLYSLSCGYFVKLLTSVIKLPNLSLIIVCCTIYLFLYFVLCYFSKLIDVKLIKTHFSKK